MVNKLKVITYVANGNVFRDCLKLFPPITGFRKLLAGNSRQEVVSAGELALLGFLPCKRDLCRHVVSVCVSVTFVHSVETNKHIVKFFHR